LFLVWQLNNFIIYPVFHGREKQGIGGYSEFMNYFSASFIKGIKPFVANSASAISQPAEADGGSGTKTSFRFTRLAWQ